MSEHCKQHASALFDNHFGDDGAEAESSFQAELSVVLNDDNARLAWQRYALVGHILREEAPSSQQLDISAAVAAKISQENVLIQPSAKRSGALSRAASRWFKPAGSIAIAASVALVAVLSVQQPVAVDGATGADESMNPAVVTNPFGGRNPVSYNTLVEQQAPSAAEVEVQQQLLMSYMNDHQQQLQLSMQANKQQLEATENTEKSTEQND